MQRLLLSILFCFSFFAGLALEPGDFTERSMLDSSLAPFYHGVASGDPTPNAVIIWTRVTPEVAGPVTVNWHVALDTAFVQTVKTGTFTTDSTRDYTVKVDVTGLQPNTWYFYEFTVNGKNSVTGRTKTAPVSGQSQQRFAFVSCSNYPNGFFNAYDRITERNDIDAVIHLGDYIYEYGTFGIPGRTDQLPAYEITKLADYRQRYSTYRLDPSCRNLHQQYPFISVWDDHETANNSYTLGSDNHTEGVEGLWSDRKSYGQKAYDEWMPIRLPEPGNPNKIWRKISYGNLVDIFMLDTRLYDRSKQGGNPNDTSRHIIGNEQMQWLKNELINSTAKWKVLGQQVMMGNLNPFWQNGSGGILLNNDQWDGYKADRKKLYDIILDNNIKNVVVLTGDIHTAWAMDLPYNQAQYNAFTGAGSVGVEFVCTSVTSGSSPIALNNFYPLVGLILPHIKNVELTKKGYSILDLSETKTQCDFYYVKTVANLDTNQTFDQGWYTDAGTRWLKKARSKTTQTIRNIYEAPLTPRTSTAVGVKNKSNNLVLLSAYPNPFIDKISVQFNTATATNAVLNVFDLSGRLVKQQDLGFLAKGLHQKVIDLNDMAAGAYKLVITNNNNDIIEQTIEKF
ncbi:MAG: alkaline phosphatase D family protein [Chitinophagales bacterium]